MGKFKKFLISSSLIFVLIIGVITAYIFNVNAQPIVDLKTDDTAIEAIVAEQETPTETIDPVFGNNSWATIAKVFKAGQAAEYWTVGDTKEVELSDGYTYEVQIVDMTPNRYALSNGTGYSNGVLQFVKCLDTSRCMNSFFTNGGGYAYSAMRVELNTTVYNQLPDDLKAVISEVSVSSGIGNGTTSGIMNSDNKLFLASEYEVFGKKIYSIGDDEGQPQFGYWALHNTDNDRVKTKINDSFATWWWLRSSSLGNSTYFCGVHDTGFGTHGDAPFIAGVCPCFAF